MADPAFLRVWVHAHANPRSTGKNVISQVGFFFK